jgi:magnesium chelatase family protein
MTVVRRSLEIAAAGWHHFLMVGSPGAGKTLCAQCVPGILAPMSASEALESTMIHSCSGLLKTGSGLLKARPFRAPHHTASAVALVGGGRLPRPGEVSLAHNGMLFLDEFPEFSRSSLEGLRQPLEEGSITVTRSMESVLWPARFLLGAAMNPCPCGYSLDPLRECRCSPSDVQRYRQRVSGPMLDRIDLQIQVPNEEFDVFRPEIGESSAKIAERVHLAADRQVHRYRKLVPECEVAWNSRLRPEEVRKFCTLNAESEFLLKQATQKLKLSARGVIRVLKVSRTIADLQGTNRIEISHVAEAVQYRLLQ